MKYLKFFLTAIIGLIILKLPIFAADTVGNKMLRVSPVIANISLSPGSVQNFDIKIENLLPIPMPVSATVEGFDSADEEGGFTFKNNQTDSPLISWTTIDQPDLLIPPNGVKTIQLSVKVPSQVAVGGYYAVVFLTPSLPSSSANPTIIPRIGVLMLASLGVPNTPTTADKMGQIVDYTFTQNLYDSGSVNFFLRVKNSTLIHLSAKPILRIEKVLGRKTENILAEKIILPGKIRRWDYSSDIHDIGYGIYNFKLALSLGHGKILYTHKYIVIMPWISIIEIILIVSVVMFIYLRRKYLKIALKTLFKG
jgi:hypothetical protein